MTPDRAGRDWAILTASKRRDRRRRENGSAFAAIVLPLLILAAVAASVTSATRTELMVARTIEAEIQSRLAAEAGINTAILNLVAPGQSGAWTADGSVFKVRFADLDVEVSVQNETAKINLNQAPNPPLERLLALSCLGKEDAARLMERLADYVDADDLARPGGAERDAYETAGLAYGPANARLRTIGELRRVPGVTAGLLSRLRPFVTVHGFHGVPELRLAQPKTIAAVLGVDEEKAGREPPQAPAAVAASVGVFTLTARVTSNGLPPGATEAVAYLTGDAGTPVRILDWRRRETPEPIPDACPPATASRSRP